MDLYLRLAVVESEEPLDPPRIGFLRSRGVVLGQARLTDLIGQLHGSRMACEDSNVNIWEYER